MNFENAIHIVSRGIDYLSMEDVAEISEIEEAESELYRLVAFLKRNNIKNFEELKEIISNKENK
jgi:predicted transcriptional regulator